MKNVFLLSMMAAMGVFSAAAQQHSPSLTPPVGTMPSVAQFQRADVPFEARPWCFWYWMNGAVSRQGITADLEAMAEHGLAGTYLMPIKDIADKPELGGTVRQLSPEWWEMVDFAKQEADRLGLRLGIHICDGFALAGGPWITEEESMQKVIMTDATSAEGNTIGYYALPSAYYPADQLIDPASPGFQRPRYRGYGADLDLDTVTGSVRANKPCYFDYIYDDPVTVRAIELKLQSNQFQAHRMRVLASMDGQTFRLIKQLEPARAGWQNYDFNTTHSIPTTTARYWRFEWSPVGTEPGAEDIDQAKWNPMLKINRIFLHQTPAINQWEGKSGLVWRVSSAAQNTLEADEYIPMQQVVYAATLPELQQRLLAKAGKGKKAQAQVEREWRIVRMAHITTGHDNATGGAAKGLECDKFSAQAVQKQLDRWFNAHANRMRNIYMHIDSWECGCQNWSRNFAAEFQRRSGYDLMPYLPLMGGVPLQDETTSERVLRDIRLTINDLIQDVFFATLRHNADSLGVPLSAESVAPTMISDGMQHYRQADIPMGEFWLNSPTHDKVNDMLDAISGGHIYNKPVIQAEGFTEVRGVWNEYPAMLKPLLDRNYCLGINRLFFHVYAHNPRPEQRPGMTLDGIGLFYQRNQTWWREGRAFTDYIRRCQVLLQMGRPVVDVAVYTGQEMPRRAFTPDRMVNMLPGIVGAQRVADEAQRMANVGQPTQVRPIGVTSSRNQMDAAQWINTLRGYQYDSFNEDALLTTDKALDYKVFVLPRHHKLNPDGLALPEGVSRRVEELKRRGLVVIGQEQLPWADSTFATLGVKRDVDGLPYNQVAYCHRTAAEAEVYFLSNQTDGDLRFTATFRDHHGRQAELWDAMTGTIRRAAKREEQADGAVPVAIELAAGGSVFVVFPAQPADAQSLAYEPTQEATVVTDFDHTKWEVVFHETGVRLSATELFRWDDAAQPDSIRYYSGRATYRTTFRLPVRRGGNADAVHYYLKLEGLYNVASVRVNGYDCGVVWTAPYEVDVTEALQSKGDNVLEIDVVNTWANALEGHELGKAPFGNIWTNARYRHKGVLFPSGLEGPVRIVTK